MDSKTDRQEWRKWYKTKQWQSLRSHQLAKHPYCQCPIHQGKDRSAVATVVDHIIPHKGSKALFTDTRNLQSMAKHCHDSLKQEQDRTGTFKGCDRLGNPLDSKADWWLE